MALHTLAAVVDDELSRGSPSSSPSNMQQQQRTNNANASSIAIIPGEHSAEDEKIDLKGTMSKGPVRKRVPRSEEKGTSVSKITKKKKKKKVSDGGGIAKKSKDDNDDEGGGEGGGGEPNAVSSVSTAASYRDYSTLTEEEMCDPASLIYSSASAKESPFPAKLHRILSNPDFQDVISFLPHGRSWRVLKPKAFEERVIPLFFRHCRYSSFMRQVNGWGFQRVHQGPDVNSYYHEMFLRGMPHLSLKMRRPSAKEMKARAVELVRQDVPDFYKISEKSPLPEYDFVKSGKKSKKKGKNNARDETDGGNDDASNAETETASAAQQQQDQQQQGQAAQLQAGVALPQLLGLVALQEKQKQLLAAAAGQQQPQAQLQVPNAPVGLPTTNAALAALLGGGAGSVSPQLNLNPAQVLSPAAQQPMVVQSGVAGVQPAALGNVTLLQLLVAQQEQQQRQQAAQAQAQAQQQAAQAQAQQQQQQQQQLALLQSSGLLGATQAAAAATANAANAGAGSNADAELNRLRAALASSQMQNQVMAAALLSKQPPQN